MIGRMVFVLLGFTGLLFLLVAPVPSQSDEAPQKGEAELLELEALWSDLYGEDPAASTAVIKFYKNPAAAIPFLKEKLKPLKLDPEQCRQWLKELGSKDEAEWKAAWEKLDYLDPRLAIDLKTLMDEVNDAPARTRMVEICSDRKADSLVGQQVILRAVGNDGFNFFAGGSWWAEHRIERIGSSPWRPKKAWTRAARCVAILEQIGSQDSVAVLLKLANGHPDAFPTKAARESLLRMKK